MFLETDELAFFIYLTHKYGEDFEPGFIKYFPFLIEFYQFYLKTEFGIYLKTEFGISDIARIASFPEGRIVLKDIETAKINFIDYRCFIISKLEKKILSKYGKDYLDKIDLQFYVKENNKSPPMFTEEEFPGMYKPSKGDNFKVPLYKTNIDAICRYPNCTSKAEYKLGSDRAHSFSCGLKAHILEVDNMTYTDDF